VREVRYPAPALILKIGGYPIHHGGLGIIRSLGMLGIPVYTVIENRYAPAAVSRYLTGTFVWNTRGVERTQLLEGLEKIGQQLNQPTILVPTDDYAASLIAEEAVALREWFVFPDVKANIPRTLANKQLLHGLSKDLGIPQPQAIFPNSIHEVQVALAKLTFPAAIKLISSWPRAAGTPSVQIVDSPEALLSFYHQRQIVQTQRFFIQEHIPDAEDWFFHGYCNTQSDCLVAFTGRKLRSYPPHGGITVLGQSVTNDVLSSQAERLLKAINYAGIMDIDYRLDKRDGQYKILDFNPRIGAQFRLFEDRNGIDVVKAMYYDLTGQPVCRSPQIDGRIFIVEPQDFLCSLYSLWRRKLTLGDWWRSLRGVREFAWFKWNDPAPCLILSIHMVIRGIVKAAHRVGLRRPSD